MRGVGRILAFSIEMASHSYSSTVQPVLKRFTCREGAVRSSDVPHLVLPRNGH